MHSVVGLFMLTHLIFLSLLRDNTSLATLRDHATGNPPAEAIFKLFATWHEHVRAVWAYDDVCNGLDHNVSDQGR